jgi:hypothetical protein
MTVEYNTGQYSTVQYSTVHDSTVQYSTAQYSTVQYSTVQYSTAQVAIPLCAALHYDSKEVDLDESHAFWTTPAQNCCTEFHEIQAKF